MTIADLAGPVLLQVLPTTFAVLLATSVAALLPFAVPRFIAWLKGGDVSPSHPAAPHATPARTAAHDHPVRAHHDDEQVHTYSI